MNTPKQASSVVPALGLAADMCFVTSLFIKLDFPALGAPIRVI